MSDVNSSLLLTEKRQCVYLLLKRRQGSLLDIESWLFRLCGRGPTLAF